MKSRSALAATAVLVTALACAVPNSAVAVSKGHINSNVNYTYLYADSHGAERVGALYGCDNFTWDRTENGRYHSPDMGGSWISMDKAGPGWCGD